MATARKEIVDGETQGFYRCTNRGVRHAFLCGIEQLAGQNFEHRKVFIEQHMLG